MGAPAASLQALAVHLGVAAHQLDAAVKALKAAGIEALPESPAPQQESGAGLDEGIELGIIGAILRGPLG